MVPGQTGHFTSLTGLRGLAAWWVVLFHFTEYMPVATPDWVRAICGTGYLAVDLFFILSGFILGFNYLSGFQSFQVRHYLRFLGARLARIYPLHVFMLAAFLLNPLAILIAASQGMDTSRYNGVYFLLSLFLVQNWGFTDHLAWNIPAWSISTEWFAYLCFPFVAWLVNRMPRHGFLLVLGLLLPLAALGFGLCAAGETLGGDIARTGLPRCITEFTAGIFLYRAWRHFGRAWLCRMAATAVAVLCLAVSCLSDISDFWLMPLGWAAVIISLANGLRPFSAILSSRLLQVAGAWSYSTYLVHYFMRDWVKFLLIHNGPPGALPLACYLGATAAASALLYRLVELPGRRIVRHQVDQRVRQPT